MKKIFVEQISERDQVDGSFLVRDKILAMAKNGKPYLTLKLMDRTGEIEGRVWDDADRVSAKFAKDDFIHVRGKASLYMGKMQLIVQELELLQDNDITLADFLPVSVFTPDQLVEKLQAKVASLEDIALRQLMEAFLADQEFIKLYSSAPAAKTMHHVFLGGLLEHSLSVSDLVDDICQHYPTLNRDLLLVGSLLHDVGKVVELSYKRSFDYTDEGKLLGHIILGVEMVSDKIREVDNFPVHLATLLKHLLLSHHGQYEYGSPKRPKTLEAIVLNFLDDLDSKINGVSAHIERETANDSDWTSYHRLYDRYFYKGDTTRSTNRKENTVPAVKPVSRREAPLEVTLGDRLKGESLDLFSVTGGGKTDES